MSRHLTRAITVVKATVRFKLLAAQVHARDHADLEEGLQAGDFLDGSSPTSDRSRPTSRGPFSPADHLLVNSIRPGSAATNCSSRRERMSLSESFMDLVKQDDSGQPLPWYQKDAAAAKAILTSNWINLLLLCVPLGIASHLLHWGAVPTFLLNFLALVPLALVLGDVTEDLAVRFGDAIGGLLNATFGNVVEMILSVAALFKGLYTVVAASLLGSILSNLLLVLGCCFLLGGIRYKIQTFNAVANQASSSLLFLSCIGIIIPTCAGWVLGGTGASEAEVLAISRTAAVVLLVLYVCYLGFQLVTHTDIFQEVDEDHDPMLTFFGAIFMLTCITALVAVASEYLTSSIEEFTRVTGLTQTFVGIVILPIAGNACEHITAVMVALKNKMDLSMGVAVGSSIQIAIFAIPFVVVVGWATGHPFSLDFDPFSVLALTLAVVHANFVTAANKSHWLMGAQLIAVYILVASVFLYKGDSR